MKYLVKPMKEPPEENVKLRPFVLRGVPFAWQDVRVMKIVRENYIGKRRTTAIAIYQTFTELTSIAGRGQGKHVSQFPAYIQTVAEMSGRSGTTIRRYSKEFRKLGILSWERRRKGKMNLSNLWKLLAYSCQDNETTPFQNRDVNPSGQNSGLVKEEDVRKYINNKERFKNFKNNNGFHSVNDILKKYKKL